MRQIALGIIVTGLITTSAFADEPANTRLVMDSALAGVSFTTPALTQTAPAPEEPAKKVTVLAGADFPSVYFFRGIRQETDPSFTFQPFVDVGITASDMVTVNVGSWNSIHSGSTKDAFGAFYESDFYASAAFAAGMVTPKVMYTAYTSPDDAFNTVHELAFSAAFNDSESAFALSPSVLIAAELGDYGADGGANKGIYAELGVAPGIPMGDDTPFSLTVPLKIGLSLKDYYENPLTEEDDKFGYFSAGVSASVPVNDMFEVHGGVQMLLFGDNVLKLYNDDESTQFIASVGFGVKF